MFDPARFVQRSNLEHAFNASSMMPGMAATNLADARVNASSDGRKTEGDLKATAARCPRPVSWVRA
jgi:hypothetical protein